MKRKYLKKVVSAALIGTLVVSAVSGCGNSEKESTDSKKTGENSEAWEKAATDPFAPYPELVTYTLGKDTQASPNFPEGDSYENNGYTRYLKNKLNVQNKNEFEAQGGDDYDRKVSLAITSGELPDIMTVSNIATLKQLVENDLVEDLTESYEKCASDAIKEIYDSFDGRALENATFDGKLMAIPSATPGIGAGLVWLRQDWLDALNLEGPKTLEDLEHVLEEFVTKDPGGNGEGKTIGLAASEKGLFGNYGALNSMDSVSDRDYVIELLSAMSTVMMHLSRFCEEIILWNSNEYRFVEIDDAYSTGSSIMPQKKNPDIAELVRGKTGRVYGALTSILTTMKGIPLAYNKDMQEDKELTFDAIDTVKGCIALFTGMVSTMEFRKDVMEASAKNGFTNATDAADYLVNHGVPFRDAHGIVGRLVLTCIDKGISLDELPLEEYKEISPVFEQDIYEAISMKTCVEKRETYGAPGPKVMEQIIAGNKEYLKNN